MAAGIRHAGQEDAANVTQRFQDDFDDDETVAVTPKPTPTPAPPQRPTTGNRTASIANDFNDDLTTVVHGAPAPAPRHPTDMLPPAPLPGELGRLQREAPAAEAWRPPSRIGHHGENEVIGRNRTGRRVTAPMIMVVVAVVVLVLVVVLAIAAFGMLR